MAAVDPCLAPDLLRRLVEHSGPEEEIEKLTRHLEVCETCGKALDTLLARDATLAGLRGSPGAALPRGQALQDLQERLRRLRPAADAGRADDRTPLHGDTSTTDPPAGAAAERTEAGLDFLAPAQQADELGRLGAYRILRKLGAGGMGLVFLAEDTLLRRRVALKTMLPQVAASPEARERFLREARAAASIEHEHIVAIHHVGEDNHVAYLAMPLLRGESLESRLGRAGRLPVAEALRIAAEMAEGLAAAHAGGMIHRDIKPGNVWLEGEQSKVKLLDFGLVRSQADPSRLTQEGGLVGTPAYMAPEQAQGAAVDGRADLFSLGCVLYQMLTGRRPFQGKDPVTVLWSLAMDRPPAPQALNPEVPGAVSELTLRLLSKDPAGRPASARDVVEQIAALQRQLASPKPPPRRRRRRLAIAGAALLALAAAAAYFTPTILRVATNKGELMVQVEDPGIEVLVKQDGAVVQEKSSGRSFELKAVDGEIEVFEKDGVHLLTKKFTLTRGGRTTVTVTHQELAAAKQTGPGDDPDRRVAEWVLKHGGEAEVILDGQARWYRGAAEAGDLPPRPFRLHSFTCKALPIKAKDVLERLPGLTALEDLVLLDVELTDGDLERLASVPGLTDRLRKLRLGAPSAPGFEAFTEAGLAHLARFRKLVLLEIRSPRITDAGMKHVSQLPTLHESLTINAPITDAGLHELRGLKLRSLELTSKEVTDAGLTRLANIPLVLLQLNDCVITDAGLKHFQTYSELCQLKLVRTRITDAGMATLATLPKLETLGIQDTPITDEGVARLKGLTRLHHLTLTGTKVTDAGLAHLAGLEEIEGLVLIRTGITDAGLEHLWRLKTLKGLTVHGTKVTAEGVKKLSAALPECVIVSDHGTFGPASPEAERKAAEWVLKSGGMATVVLDGKEESFQGDVEKLPARPFRLTWVRFAERPVRVRVEELAQNLRGLAGLRRLELFRVGLTDTGLERLASVPALADSVETLSVGWGREGDAFTDTGLAHLARFRKLEGLHVRSANVTDAGLKHVGKIPTLHFLVIEAPISDEGLRELRGLKLRSLELSSKDVTDAGLAHLRDMPLCLLSLTDCPITDDGLKHLQTLPILDQLQLIGTRVTDAGMATIGTLTGLCRLDIVKSPITDEGVARLKGLVNLRRLLLHTTKVTDAGLAHVAPLKELNDLVISSADVTDAGLEHLKGLTNLRGLDVRSTRVTAEGVKRLAAVLQKCTILSDHGNFEPGSVPPADQDQPFVLLRDGKPAGEFKAIAGAVRRQKAGDVIEVHGNGPFAFGPLPEIDGWLKLRAAPGYRPWLVAPTLVRVEQARIDVEGCDIDARAADWLFQGSGPSWQFRRCRFWCRGGLEYNGPRVRLEDCLVLTGGPYFLNVLSDGVVEFDNCLAGTSAFVIYANEVSPTIRLKDSTFVTGGQGGGGVLHIGQGKGAAVEAEGNLFQYRGAGGSNGPVFAEGGPKQVRWQGRDNLYTGTYNLLAREQGQYKPGTLFQLNPLWEKSEERSRALLDLDLDWSRPNGPDLAAARAFYEPAVATAQRRHRLTRLGPNWDLVGPGEAYLRALEKATGKPIPEDLRLPEVLDGKPVVLLRGGKVQGSFALLTDAIDAAEDRDVIEVRTNGEIVGWQGKGKNRLLTIRAAPGYAPVVKTLDTDGSDRLIVEGLKITALWGFGASPWLGHGKGYGGSGGIVRMVNCNVPGPVAGCFRGEGGQPAEVRNCRLGALRMMLGGNRLRISNSVVRALLLDEPEAKGSRLEVEDCVLADPDLGSPYYNSLGLAPHDLPRTALAVSMRRTYIQASSRFCGLFDSFTWEGSGNVFCVPQGYEYDRPDTPTLAAWRAKFKSDADSVEGVPAQLDPALWRVRPESPGYEKRKDGRDYGADIDRLGRALTTPDRRR